MAGSPTQARVPAGQGSARTLNAPPRALGSLSQSQHTGDPLVPNTEPRDAGGSRPGPLHEPGPPDAAPALVGAHASRRADPASQMHLLPQGGGQSDRPQRDRSQWAVSRKPERPLSSPPQALRWGLVAPAKVRHTVAGVPVDRRGRGPCTGVGDPVLGDAEPPVQAARPLRGRRMDGGSGVLRGGLDTPGLFLSPARPSPRQ